MKYGDGDIYLGYFKKGQPSGFGSLLSNKGYKFKGMFDNGLPNGSGTKIFNDGREVQGVFKNGTHIA